jgi:hypothetical protein
MIRLQVCNNAILTVLFTNLKFTNMSDKQSFRRTIHSLNGKPAHHLPDFLMLSVLIVLMFLAGCKKTDTTDPASSDKMIAAGIDQISPVNQASDVVLNPVVTVTFRNGTDPSVVAASSVTLKSGSVTVQGKMDFSGTTATFTPLSDLNPSGDYTAIVSTSKGSSKGDNHQTDYSWRFRTSSHHHYDLKVVSAVPLNGSTTAPVTSVLTVTFSRELTSGMKNAISIVVKNATSVVQGTMSFSERTATFKPSVSLTAGVTYTADVKTESGDDDDSKTNSLYTWTFSTAGGVADVTPPTVTSTVPAANATSVAVTSKVSVNFSEPMSSQTINTTTFTLSQGTTPVAGSVTMSGTTATFTPTSSLSNSVVYTATITTGAKDVAGNAMAASKSWSFTTAAAAPSDVTPPTVLSVMPATGATAVAVTAKVTVNFSEPMSSQTINTTTFTLSQGTTPVAGSVTMSGTTATFTPAASLTNSAVYTATITTGVKDVAGNAMASVYSWNFTTAAAAPSDVTPPTVLSVAPAAGATSVSVTGAVTATFSEALNTTSVNSSTFTLMQGTTSIAGSVSYSGVTATFTPSAPLANNTVYTATITTGVKDVAGNSMATVKTWSFTTVAAAPAGMSFANDVVPVLTQCNNCHTHGWTTSTNASTFYTNLATAGYINTASPTTSKIYVKLNSGHPGSSISTTDINKILTWMNEGTKNN